MLLHARGLRFAAAATCEQFLDVDAAIAAASICDEQVTKLVGSGTETQFRFRRILQEEKPLRDWMQEALMNCLGFYSFAFGRLKLGVRVNSSAVEASSIGNTLFQSLQLAPLKPSFNHLTASFADEEFDYVANSVAAVPEIEHESLRLLQQIAGGPAAPQLAQLLFDQEHDDRLLTEAGKVSTVLPTLTAQQLGDLRAFLLEPTPGPALQIEASVREVARALKGTSQPRFWKLTTRRLPTVRCAGIWVATRSSCFACAGRTAWCGRGIGAQLTSKPRNRFEDPGGVESTYRSGNWRCRCQSLGYTGRDMNRLLLVAAMLTVAASAQDWKLLFNGKDLDGWELKGDGQWKVLADGTLLAYPVSGPRNPFGPQWPVTLTEKQYMDWRQTQSWLYTVAEFGEYDLHIEYRTHAGGNSGISIRDNTRGRYSYGSSPDFTKTPAHNGYEIQIINGVKTKFPTGSIYLFAPAEFGHEKENDWNSLDIESRNERITVRLNGREVASHPGEPARPKEGPIGLQLHDRFSVMMFRNIRIRTITR